MHIGSVREVLLGEFMPLLHLCCVDFFDSESLHLIGTSAWCNFRYLEFIGVTGLMIYICLVGWGK